MSELDDALKQIPKDWNGNDPSYRESILVLRKAARRVANPDEMVKRAMRKAEQMGWPDQMDIEEVEQSVRGLIFAALGVTTEDDECE